MSEADASQTEEAEAPLDASFKVDSSALGGDEGDFAKALGFGAAGEEAAPAGAKPAAEAPSEPDTAPEEDARADPEPTAPDEDTAEAEAAETEDASPAEDDEAPPAELAAETSPPDEDESEGDAPDDARAAGGGAEDREASEPEPRGGPEMEEIHPRPAAEGMQDVLQERADAVLAAAGGAVGHAAGGTAANVDDATFAAQQAEAERAREALATTQARLAERDEELAAALATIESGALGPAVEEKEFEELRVELESVSLERDQLIDQLAATSGQLVQSQRSGEQLAASLRAARGALIPLPEGERALRAEVIGLRGRLEDAAQENLQLTSEVASVATELSIAAARVEDRQHEIDFHAERAAALETELGEKDRQLDEAVASQREAVALATRVQADNNELRSTQAALEETLQARDLEITAREEHLRVTREGLTTRDRQLVDVKEEFDAERRRSEALEADLERAAIEQRVLTDKIERRESRIATLTQTLGRIDEAMGQRIPMPEGAPSAFSRSEWTRPSTTSLTGSEPTSEGPEPIATETSPIEPAPVVAATPDEAPTAPPPAAIPEVQTEPDPEPEPEPEVEPEPEPSVAPEPDASEATEPDASEATEPVSRETFTEVVESFDRRRPHDLEDEETDDEDAPARVFEASPALPPVLSAWRDDRLEALDQAGVAPFLARRLAAHLGDPAPETVQLMSLGGGLPDTEVHLVQALAELGIEDVRVDVLDAAPDLADARRQRIELAGLGESIAVRIGDLDEWNAQARCHGILLADALDAQSRVEAILDHLAPSVERGALLLFVGRIATRPVQLSASTSMRLEELWQFLPESLAQDEGLGRAPFRGDDGGHPTPGADVPAALQSRFAAIALAGFGHLTDLVVGPDRGFGLAPEEEEAMSLLESVVAIDDSRATTEDLPPRHGVGVFAASNDAPTECVGGAWPSTD